MIWIKVDSNLDDHPKAAAAGFWGTVAVQVVWRLAKRHGKRGVLGADYVTRRHLRHVTRCDESDAAKLEDGIKACVEVGLLRVLGDGRYEVVNWPEHQEDPNHAERQAKYRARAAAERASRDASDDACPSRDEVTTTGEDRRGQDGRGEYKPGGLSDREQKAQGFIRGTWTRMMQEVHRLPFVKPDEAGLADAGRWALGFTEPEVAAAIDGLVRDTDPFVCKRGHTLRMLPERAAGYLARRTDDAEMARLDGEGDG